MPPQRLDSGMVYDSTDGYVLLFGGEAYLTSPQVFYNDTWAFSHGAWTNETNSHAPSPRLGFGLADDPADHEVVLFGGYSSKGAMLDDTWTYAAGVWSNVSALVGTPPPATYWGSMAYDNQTGTVILFGGLTGLSPTTEYTNETWSFHDNTWTELSPATSPPARNSASLVDDVSDGDLLLFGGQNETEYLNDTWSFSGADWTPVSTTDAPPVSWGAGLAYYASQSEVVLFGGTPGGEYQTYTYHAGTWTEYDPTPNPGQAIGITQMTYDYADQYVLLFADSPDAINSTWELTATSGPPPPVLDVMATAHPQSGVAPLQTALTSEVSGGTPPYTITWNFDDSTPVVTGSPSTAGNTSHIYENAGKYNTTLTVVDDAEQTVVKNWTITATATPLGLKIAASPTSAIINQSVTFTSTPTGGTPPYSYAWTFGDGATATTRNATHEYTSVGKFNAELVVHDAAGESASQTVSITVTATAPNSNSDWWVYLVVAIVVIVIAILVVVWYRRRRRQTPPAPPAPASPPPGPAGGGPSL
ncbi:MAG: PKD domain-containing protein [Thermoplasmata archaeon]